MNHLIVMRHASAIASLLVCPALLAQPAPPRGPTPGEATNALVNCLKMPAGSPQQNGCVLQLKPLQASAHAQAQWFMASQAGRLKSAPSAPTAPPQPVPEPVKTAFKQVGLGGPVPANITSLVPSNSRVDIKDVSGIDLESLMLLVQSRRAQLIEQQLADQISAVQARNSQIGWLNQAMQVLRSVQAAAAGRKDDETAGATAAQAAQVNDLMRRGGIAASGRRDGTTFDATYTKAEIAMLLEMLKRQLDQLNSSQQMDMLRLQTLNNKRNQAFDIMSNFMRKMADSRASVIGNMR